MRNKILSILLVISILLGIFPLSVFAESGSNGLKVGDIITFGSYPQSEVTDTKTLAALEAKLTEDMWVSYEYFSYISGENPNEGDSKPSDYMKYADLTLGNEKYRAVRFSAFRPTDPYEPLELENSFIKYSYNKNTTYFFKYEPLNWRVLDPSEGYVMCDRAIDSQSYQNYVYFKTQNGNQLAYNSKSYKNYASDWGTSYIRKFLNEDFFDTAFSEEEKAKIGVSFLKNKSTFVGKFNFDSASTFDRIFTVSYEDVTNTAYGFSADRDEFDSARLLKGTDYAISQGLCRKNGNSLWMTRTPFHSGFFEAVGVEGNVIQTYPSFTSIGVVPAFKFSPKSPDFKKDEKIAFGLYPQSKVTDADAVAELETASAAVEWTSYGYYSGSGEANDGEMKPDDFMLYKDFESNGEKYRAVTFKEYRPNFTGGLKQKAYSFQDDNGYFPNDVYYFKYEPLNWRVLDPDEGYVICENVIDSQAFQNYMYKKDGTLYGSKDCTNYVSDWAASSLRLWLNENVYNMAFSNEEKDLIDASYLKNISTDGERFGADTVDKLFILSYTDAVNSAYGFNSSGDENDEARKVCGTDYAACQGLYVDNDNIAWWWLRSPGAADKVNNVSYFGRAGLGQGVYGTGTGVVPAFKFNSKAVDIKVNFDLDGGEWAKGYTAPSSYKSNESLTLPSAENVKKAGYNFAGFETISFINKTVFYKAKWIVNQFTITFDTAGGSKIDSITQDYGSLITAPSDPKRKGYTFVKWDKAIPATMPAENITITAQWKDNEKPTGEIKINENSWKTLLNNITFGLFFEDTQTVTVNASDTGSGIKTVEYLLSDKEFNIAELDGMAFIAYTAPFTIDPDNEYIIYVRLTDKAGNTDYICSDGIVLDGTKPVINGVEDGKTYCGAQTVTIDEKHLDTVTLNVNGKEVTLVKTNSFVLNPSDGKQKITVTDKAGNTTEITVTVNDGHTLELIKENGKYFYRCSVCGYETKKNDVPKITEGDGLTVTFGDRKQLSFRSTAPIVEFIRAEFDGEALDEKHYTKKEGSTVITLNEDFVSTLSVGKHTLSIVSVGGMATAEFTVNAPDVKTPETSPKTGYTELFISLLGAAFIFGGIFIKSLKKKA